MRGADTGRTGRGPVRTHEGIRSSRHEGQGCRALSTGKTAAQGDSAGCAEHASIAAGEPAELEADIVTKEDGEASEDYEQQQEGQDQPAAPRHRR
eukprot:4929610-Prymnesium_polylepis.1